MNQIIFPEKAVSELMPITVNFSDRLQFGEVLNGASVAVTVFSGTDPSPISLLSGAATHTDTDVTQNFTGGVAGVVYNVVYLVTGTNSHNYVKVGQFAVVSDSNPFVTV